MATAKICDRCGKTYAARGEVTSTGNWNWKNIDSDLGSIRVVTGVFRYREGEDRNSSRGGSPLDICPECVGELLKAKE